MFVIKRQRDVGISACFGHISGRSLVLKSETSDNMCIMVSKLRAPFRPTEDVIFRLT